MGSRRQQGCSIGRDPIGRGGSDAHGFENQFASCSPRPVTEHENCQVSSGIGDRAIQSCTPHYHLVNDWRRPGPGARGWRVKLYNFAVKLWAKIV
jgi:hypothetical protein